MKRISLLLTFAITLIIFQSCQNNSSSPMSAGLANEAALEHIPSDAVMVGSMNLGSLMEKMDYDKMKELDFFQKMLSEMKDDRPELIYLMESPKESGVDLAKNIYFFSEKMDGNDMVMGTVMSLSDKGQFEKMLKKADENGKLAIEKKDGYSLATLGNDNLAIAFNDDMVVIGSGSNNIEEITAKVTDRLNNKGKKNIKSNKAFKKIDNNHDIVMFQNFDGASELLDGQSDMVLTTLGLTKEDLEGNYSISYGDFENGKMTGTQEYVLNAKIKELAKAIVKNGVKTNFSKSIPEDNLIGVMSSGLNMKGIKQLIMEQMGGFAVGQVNNVLSPYGLNFDEAMGMFDGDLFVAGYAGETKNDDPEMLLGLKIDDKKSLNKLLEAGEGVGFLQKKGNNTYAMSVPMVDGKAVFIIKNDVLLVGIGEVAETVSKGSFKTLSSSKLEKGIFNMYADAEAVKSKFPELKIDEAGEFRATGDLTGGTSTLTFNNKKENSLKVLMNLMNEMYKQSEKNESRYDSDDLKM